ncbi:hypothetical protein EsH8_IV_000134 [Colletotrichum jinshuiense]
MAKSKSRRPQRSLVQLLCLASAATTATAATIATISVGSTSLSLSNFQLITELSVPLGCLLAYNDPIQGCEVVDFDNTKSCSATCRRGLTRMQSTLQDACQAIQVQVNSLLGQALLGNLVNVLCGATKQPTSSAVQPIKPSTTVILLPPTSAVQPLPPPAATTPAVTPPVPPQPPVRTTTLAPVLPLPSQPPQVTTAVPPVSNPQPPAAPPLLPTTIVTSITTTTATTTTKSQAAPQTTSAKPQINPLDALLMSGDGARVPRGLVACCLPVLAMVALGLI